MNRASKHPCIKTRKEKFISKSRMQSFQARLLFQLLNLLPTPVIHLRQSMAWVTFTLNIYWPVEWLLVTSGIVRSKASQPNEWQMPGWNNLDSSSLRQSIWTEALRWRDKVYSHSTLKKLKRSSKMHAWFSFLLLVPSAQNWNVKFILIRFLRQVLHSVGYATIKNQSK